MQRLFGPSLSLGLRVVLVLLLSVALSSNAQHLPAPSRTVFKCQIEGKTVYSDDPCPGAKRLEIEPTRGLDRYSGRQRVGADVQRERRNELLAEAVRPLTGMTAEETKVFERRVRLEPNARRLCYRLDVAIPEAEKAERRARPSEMPEVQADLFALRSRYRELKC